MRRKKLSLVRRAQKKSLDGARSVRKSLSRVFKIIGIGTEKLDQNYKITNKIRTKGDRATEFWRDLDSQYRIEEKGAKAVSVFADVAETTKASTRKAAEQAGAYYAVRKALDTADAAAANWGLAKRIEIVGQKCEELYGSSRSVIKPYFPPETPDELLQNTRKELAVISACIMQISPSEAEKLASQFGKAVTSKIAGLVTSGALLSLVSTFGTAGTGTAIASLSGAASANATLAWVGGLLGGGMVTGTLLTGGIGLIVGLGAYKALGSDKRDFNSLDEAEQRIVQYCWMLIAMIDEYLERGGRALSVLQARTFLNSTLIPLQQMLVQNEVAICANLDRKHSVVYRQHVLRDFGPAIIDPFQGFIEEQMGERSLHYEYVIGGVFYALLTHSAVDDSIESQLFLDALRRTDPDLTDASEADLSRYLSSYNEEQLKGIANNAKGIYHELLWVEKYNAENTGTQAELYGSPYHSGADVRILDVATGEEVASYQLKATNNTTSIAEHHEKYTDIEVIATTETAYRLHNVTDSGFSNDILSAGTDEKLSALAGNTIGDRSLESAGIAATIASGQELLAMLQGKEKFPAAIRASIEKTTTAGAATFIAAYLFS